MKSILLVSCFIAPLFTSSSYSTDNNHYALAYEEYINPLIRSSVQSFKSNLIQYSSFLDEESKDKLIKSLNDIQKIVQQHFQYDPFQEVSKEISNALQSNLTEETLNNLTNKLKNLESF